MEASGLQRGGASREEPTSSVAGTMNEKLSQSHRDRASTEFASGFYQNRPRSLDRRDRPSSYTTSYYQSVEYQTAGTSFASQQRTQVYRPLQAYVPRKAENVDHFHSRMYQNRDPRDVARQNLQAQNSGQMDKSYRNSQQSNQQSQYQNSRQPHRPPQNPQMYQSQEQNRFQHGGQYSQPYNAYDQNQNYEHVAQNSQPQRYSQPNMQPMQRHDSYQGQNSRSRNYSQQSHRSEPVYHYVPQDQKGQSYQQAQPNMGPNEYPYAQQQPNQQAHAYQAYQAYQQSQPNNLPKGLPISCYGPYRLQRSAEETPEQRDHIDGIQAQIDELIRKDGELQAEKSNLLMSRHMEQEQGFQRGARYLQELSQQMFQNRLKQKGVTPDMYAEAYATEMQKMQQRQQTQSQSHRGGSDDGRGRGRGHGFSGGAGGRAGAH